MGTGICRYRYGYGYSYRKRYILGAMKKGAWCQQPISLILCSFHGSRWRLSFGFDWLQGIIDLFVATSSSTSGHPAFVYSSNGEPKFSVLMWNYNNCHVQCKCPSQSLRISLLPLFPKSVPTTQSRKLLFMEGYCTEFLYQNLDCF